MKKIFSILVTGFLTLGILVSCTDSNELVKEELTLQTDEAQADCCGEDGDIIPPPPPEKVD